MTNKAMKTIGFEQMINVADSHLGTRVLYASDDFFADCARMLQSSEPVFIDDKYDDNGKWMDGWESKRRRDGKNDYCYLKLGNRSTIKGFNVDTSHFTGNYAPAVSIEGCCAPDAPDDAVVNQSENFKWVELLSARDLQGDSHNLFVADSACEVTHLKITIYPDGGIARLRAYGEICFDDVLYQQTGINVLAAETGARAIHANDEHFGKLQNILAAHSPQSMADGWETRRRREPGNDWGIIALARPAVVERVVVDTSFFKGNFPHAISLCADYIEQTTDSAVITQSMFWDELLGQQNLKMNALHEFDALCHSNPITHLRVNIYPDGGIARLKLIGRFVA